MSLFSNQGNNVKIDSLTTQLAQNTSRWKNAWVDVVQDFGADPTGVNDSTTAIQNAINSIAPNSSNSAYGAPSNGIYGGVVYIPQGVYKVSGTVYLRSHVYIQGSGAMATRINPTGTSGYVFSVNGVGGAPAITDFGIEGLSISSSDGTTSYNASSPSVGGIHLNNADGRFFIKDIMIAQIGGTGLDLIFAQDGYFENVQLMYCGLGLNLGSNTDNGCNANHFHGVRIESCTKLLNVDGGTNSQVFLNSFTNCKFEAGQNPATPTASKMFLGNADSTLFVGCVFVPNDTNYPLITIQPTSGDNRGTVLSGCAIKVPTVHNLQFINAIATADGVSVTGCSFEGLGANALQGQLLITGCTFEDCTVPIISLSAGYRIGINQYSALSGTGIPFITGTITVSPPANPLVNATIYQNTYPFPIIIRQQVYPFNAGTAGLAVAYLGTSPTSNPQALSKFVSGSASNSNPELIELYIPSGWYYSMGLNGTLFGTTYISPVI